MSGAPLDRAERALARLGGAASGYARFDGAWIDAPPTALRAMLDAMGFPAGACTRESLHRLASLRRAALAPLICAQADAPTTIPLRGPALAHVDWRLTAEDGALTQGRSEASRDARGRAFFTLPAQPVGYHELEACGARATLISAPPSCWRPPALEDARAWGVSAQVYALRDAQTLGVGGYREIASLARAAGARGASFLGLSPLHALFSADRSKYSPYSPSNREMLETLFIDPRLAPDVAPELAQSIHKQAQALRECALVDYDGAWALARPLLAQAWRDFSAEGGGAAFDAFRARGGQALADHALFEALSDVMRAQGRRERSQWPADHQSPHSAACAKARVELAQEIGFHAFLQWLADTQLAQAAGAARAAGMEIGLYRDLAVGPDRAGSETWRRPEDYLLRASIGAPPDLFAPAGQNWGLPPFDPVRLEQDGLRAFRALLRANMRCAGAIRIDHGFQLERLYLVPEGASPDEGVYVASPFEPMLACLRIESQRARCMVIAEDLGTAPPGFSEEIMRAGLLSYRLLMFERDAQGGFNASGDWPREALAAISTHDLPTLAGWRRGLDIALRAAFFGDAQTDDVRRAERRALAQALAREGLTPLRDDDGSLRVSVTRFLARTPARLCAVQAEDLAGEWSQSNLPGPERGYPNWRRRLSTSLEALARDDGPLATAAACMAQEGRSLRPGAGALASAPPRAVYRLQMRAQFRFDDAARLAPYLAALGVSHVYLSPIMRAARGSAHGYDATDPAQINPALGGEDGFLRLSEALRAQGLKILLDFAPNHLSAALDSDDDASWWRSLLEWGQRSPFAEAFDIDWARGSPKGKILLPVLDIALDKALADGSFVLAFDPKQGAFSAQRQTTRFPLNPIDCAFLLERAIGAAGASGHHMAQAQALVLAAARAKGRRRQRLGEASKRALVAAMTDAPCAKAMRETISCFNEAPERACALARLLRAQAYRLAHWRLGDSQLNYRRFFDVTALAGLRVEEPRVFERVHEKIFALIEQGHVAGLRIDHIDGLADPGAYLERLQARVGPGFYIVVEKILARDETPPAWPIAGTTGYETLTRLDALFVAQAHEADFDDANAIVCADDRPFAIRLREVKREMIDRAFRPERDSLVDATQKAAGGHDLDRRHIEQAWCALIAALPVYRTYLSAGAPREDDARSLKAALELARTQCDADALEFIHGVLFDPAPDARLRDVRRRFEQTSGPVMAKSLEDTLFYRDARFVALNEVGGSPDIFGLSVGAFHAHAQARARSQPHGLVATQTHDAKRGEDLRARLAALSHIPETWRALFESAPAPECPDANDRSLLLQTFLGAWPAHGGNGEALSIDEPLLARFQAYATKALRESKRRSDWRDPNTAYEEAARRWIEDLCAHEPFLDEMGLRFGALARAGFRVSLARTALKLTCPGAPDLYQGCEASDFSLVDPDNRRPVDYALRLRMMEAGGRGFDACKFALTRALLADRKHAPALYAFGDYEPLMAPDGWIGFRRNHGGDALLVAACVAPFTHAPAPAWAQADATWRNLLAEVAFPSASDARAGPPAIVLRAQDP